ncbi:hypothetical protein FQF70_21040 [Escherichia coli]|nr:hypothetical protein [Escherichia coli]EFE7837027.1 hypothetical protein [Escherichia coli]EFN4088354.1 hypothetical protein [Escherichia coli]EFN4559793.1 hypothetical protein [Escherichia coli]EFO2682539.1 hypothetical protein [Escherichia coli]
MCVSLSEEVTVPPGASADAGAAQAMNKFLAQHSGGDPHAGQNGKESNKGDAEHKHEQGWPPEPQQQRQPGKRGNAEQTDRW